MTTKEMDRLIAHCDRFFGQTDCMVMHPLSEDGPHIDILRYEPTAQLPYWKLVTMGASDYAMPKSGHTLGNRNEYVMFVDGEEADLGWYTEKLALIAMYPIFEKCAITYGHSVEWGEEEDSDMVSAYLEMPQLLPNVEFLRCKLGLMKQTVLLQAIPLTREETDKLLEIGPEQFSNYLYPENGDLRHFLSQQRRTDRF